MNHVSIIIPAHNEEKTIEQVIDKVQESTIELEIIVVNNCSTDKTKEKAQAKGVKVVDCLQKGKGYAMEEGLKHAQYDIVAFIDGDLGIYSDDVVGAMVNPIIEKRADFTKSAFTREGGRVTELVAKPLLQLLLPELAEYEQPLSGIIAGRKEIFDSIELEKDYGVDIGILIDAYKKNIKIEEVHIGRIDNNSQSWQSLSLMAKEVAKAILKRTCSKEIK